MPKKSKKSSLPLSKRWQMIVLIFPTVALLVALDINLAQNMIALSALDVALSVAAIVVSLVYMKAGLAMAVLVPTGGDIIPQNSDQ